MDTNEYSYSREGIKVHSYAMALKLKGSTPGKAFRRLFNREKLHANAEGRSPVEKEGEKTMKKMVVIMAAVLTMAAQAQAADLSDFINFAPAPVTNVYFSAGTAVSSNRAGVVVKPGVSAAVGIEDSMLNPLVPGFSVTNELSYYAADFQRAGEVPVDGGIWSLTALQSAKYTISSSPISPWVSAGLGAAFVHQDANYLMPNGKDWASNDLAFAYQASTGLTIALPGTATMDVSYKFTGTSGNVDNGALGVHAVGVSVHIPLGR